MADEVDMRDEALGDAPGPMYVGSVDVDDPESVREMMDKVGWTLEEISRVI